MRVTICLPSPCMTISLSLEFLFGLIGAGIDHFAAMSVCSYLPFCALIFCVGVRDDDSSSFLTAFCTLFVLNKEKKLGGPGICMLASLIFRGLGDFSAFSLFCFFSFASFFFLASSFVCFLRC